MENTLYYGDNLTVLREHVEPESIDLIYLDPPFNSKQSYNVLYKSPTGKESKAQVEAFTDTWKWGEEAEESYGGILASGHTQASELLRALRKFMHESDVMAYLSMMAIRLIELHRVLKPTGSIYLHCDTTASHYLKLVMDAIFGPQNFRNEIIWIRTSAHANVSQKFAAVHDVLLFYTRSDQYTWNQQYTPYEPEYVDMFFDQVDKDGRRYSRRDLTASMSRASSGQLYEWHGIRPPASRCWAMTKNKMDELEAKGKIHWPKKSGGMPRLKLYPEDMPGVPLKDAWTDIRIMHNLSSERLGYATQKPEALLERIVQASSNEEDTVLDPFCGCGTAVVAAQKLKRSWIGIDITHLAINLIEIRLKSAFPGIQYNVIGIPKDIGGAQDLSERDSYEFQYWACSLVNAHPFNNKKKGADSGVDGFIYFKPDGKTHVPAIVSVKGGKHVGEAMIRDLIGTMEEYDAPVGVFITLTPPTKPMRDRAFAAGKFKSAFGEHYRVQILTIDDLFNGKRPDIPCIDMSHTYRLSKRASGNDENQNTLF